MSPQTSPTSQHAAAVSSPATAKPTAVADDTASQHSSSSSSVFSLFPSGRLRIAHVFGLQVLFVAACFSFTLAYLFVSLRTEIDNNTNQIISGVMQQYQDAMTPPLFSATYVALRLHDELPLRNLLIPQLPNNTISSHLTTYSAYKQGMRELPFCDYIYEDYKTSDYDAVHNLNYWDEAVCGLKNCYRVTNNSAVLITIPSNDGWVPSNFSQATRDNPEYLTFQPNVEGYYINTIRSIPVNNTEGMWGVPYVWLEDTIDHIFPLQSFLVCFDWNTTTNTDAAECTHSLTIEMNMQRLSEALQTIISADASSAALVHMNTLRLISNTLPGMTLINMTGLTNFDNLYGTSLLTSRMWNAFHTPSEMLTKAMHTFFASCVMSRQFDRTIGVTDLYSYEYSQMSDIAAIDDQIVGMRIIELSNDTQYLFLVFTPRSYFYASTDRALRNAIIVAVVVSVVVVGIVMLLFFSVSSAMRSLLDNIMVAESLDYERVTETSMILYETQRVHDAFLALN
ncbi:transmembrane protein, putative, partial [Bodo saltans]